MREILQDFCNGNQYLWQRLAGGLLHEALRKAVTDALDYDTTEVLEEYWDLISSPQCARQIRNYCQTEYGKAEIASGRLHRNACALVATAGAAEAARQVLTYEDACEDAYARLLGWWRRASQELTSSLVAD